MLCSKSLVIRGSRFLLVVEKRRQNAISLSAQVRSEKVTANEIRTHARTNQSSLFFNYSMEALSPNNGAACLIVSFGNQTIALCIDARLSGDVSLSASRKIFTGYCILGWNGWK